MSGLRPLGPSKLGPYISGTDPTAGRRSVDPVATWLYAI